MHALQVLNDTHAQLVEQRASIAYQLNRTDEEHLAHTMHLAEVDVQIEDVLRGIRLLGEQVQA